MVIGDSIQAGTNLVRADNQATARLQRHGNLIVHNFSSPGATMVDLFFPGMNHASESVALASGYFGMYGVVINLGTNDWGLNVPLTTFSSVYGAFVDSIPSRIKVACMGLTWSTGEGMSNANGDSKTGFRTATETTCTARGAVYLDGIAAIPNDPAYFSDGVHPNDRGHKAMGAFLLRQLRTLGWAALPR